MMGGKEDLETGGKREEVLYPGMTESPEIRWGFIRKVYCILSVQILLTIAVAAVVIFVKPITDFVLTTRLGLAIHIVVLILPLILLCPLYAYRQQHPLNFIFLALFTICMSFGLGMICARTSGKVILEAAILTATVVISLTIYTFWAARRGHDFNFLGPFLFGSLLVLVVFGLIQVIIPLGKISVMIYGALGAIIFSGYIIYDTDNLIKRHTYDDYIWAAVALYLDIINLFLSLLNILRVADN